MTTAAIASPPVPASRRRAPLLLLVPQGVFGSLHIALTLRGVYIAQTILALPYIVALTPAAIQGLPPGLPAQARALGAGRVQLAMLAPREAKIGVIAALAQVNDYANYPYTLAIGIVLLELILILTAVLTVLQQRTSGIHLRFRMGT